MLGSKTLKLASVAAVTTLLAMPAFVGEANAAAKAFSSLHIEDFVFTDAGTGEQLEAGDFDLLLIGNTSNNSANLTGFVGETFGDGPTAGDADAAHACVGNGCASIPIGENDFSQQTFPPPDSFARGDSALTGSAIGGSSVTADSVGEVQLLSTETGSGASDVGTDTTFSFVLDTDRQVTVSFAAQGMLDVRLDPDSAPGSTTGADFEWSITVRNADTGAVVFEWSPDGTVNANITGGTENADGADLSQEVTRQLPGQTFIDTGLALFSATTDLLSANVNYTLTISHSSFARATLNLVPVPEPASLALFSLGLLAVGLIAMQRGRSNGDMA